MTAGLRAALCLGTGIVLWVVFGAVQGARYWQVSGSGFTVGLLVAGALFGVTERPPAQRGQHGHHLAEAALLVIPGFATMLTAGPDAHPDGVWWYVTLTVGMFGAAGTHKVAADLRRSVPRAVGRFRRRRHGTALASGRPSR